MFFDKSLERISEGPDSQAVNDRIGRGRQSREAENRRLDVEIKFEIFFFENFKFRPNDDHRKREP